MQPVCLVDIPAFTRETCKICWVSGPPNTHTHTHTHTQKLQMLELLSRNWSQVHLFSFSKIFSNLEVLSPAWNPLPTWTLDPLSIIAERTCMEMAPRSELLSFCTAQKFQPIHGESSITAKLRGPRRHKKRYLTDDPVPRFKVTMPDSTKSSASGDVTHQWLSNLHNPREIEHDHCNPRKSNCPVSVPSQLWCCHEAKLGPLSSQ